MSVIQTKTTKTVKVEEIPNVFPMQEGRGRPTKIENLVPQTQGHAMMMTAARKASSIIKGLDKMTDQDLIANYVSVSEGSKLNFIIRGSIGYEAIKRAVARDGELSKEKGRGADTVIKGVCDAIPGADRHTFQEDSRIFDNFGPTLIGQLEENLDSILPREFYMSACKVSKTGVSPTRMLEYFEDKYRAIEGYYTGHARRDVMKVNRRWNDKADASKLLRDIDQEDVVERARAVKQKAEKKKNGAPPPVSPGGDGSKQPVSAAVASVPVAKHGMTSIPIANTEENRHYVSKILTKYGSVEKWMLLRAKEEFGAFKPTKNK